MRRIIVLLTVLAAFAASMAVVVPAQAAVTCSIHQVFVDSWDEGGDWGAYSTHFKCGGSTSDYRLHVFMQIKQNGTWSNDTCGSDFHVCEVYKPSNSTWFANGDDSTPGGSFTSAHQIDGETYRFRVVVKFRNGDPDIPYNSQSQVF